MSGSSLRWLGLLLAAAALGFLGWQEWLRRQAAALPAGIVSGNGRIESVQVDVATKYAGRIRTVTVREGDMVEPGQVLVHLDTLELEAELAKGNARIAEFEEQVAQAKAEIVSQESQRLYARHQMDRAERLLGSRTITRDEYEEKESKLEVADAAVNAAKAHLRAVQQSVEVAHAEVRRVQAEIDDTTLHAPVRGRVLYKLATEGEVLAAGGKALTLLDLGDIYMEIFLPARDAARVKLGADARIRLDVRPEYAGRATVSFVSPEAQFTPKQVETASERDKLMFRVKLQVPPDLVRPYLERIKTGIRGMGYVKVDAAVAWPDELDRPFPPPEPAAEPAPALPPVAPATPAPAA
jgi:HlyD family secretion protein